MNTAPLTPALVALGLAALLTACPSPPALQTAPPPPPPQLPPISVTGKVLDSSGAPLPGLPVLLGDTATRTDATGGFAGAVRAPYRLVVVVPDRNDPARREALVFDGVGRADPVVVVTSLVVRTATLTVNFSGSVSPGGTPNGAMVLNGWTGATVEPGTTFTRNWTWYGSNSLSGPLCFLRMGDFNAPKFTGFAYLSNVTLQADQPVSYGATLSPVQTVNLSGVATVPPGYRLERVSGGFNCGREGGPVVSQDTSGSASFSVPIPVLPVPLWVSASAAKGAASGSLKRAGVTPVSSLSLAVPAAPEFLGPADGTVGLTPAAEFAWTPFAGGLNRVYYVPSSPGGLAYTVATTGGSTRLPDLSALGFPPAKGATHTWQVHSLAPVRDVDAWLSGEPFDYSGDYSLGHSGPRQFTTAP